MLTHDLHTVATPNQASDAVVHEFLPPLFSDDGAIYAHGGSLAFFELICIGRVIAVDPHSSTKHEKVFIIVAACRTAQRF